MNACDLEVGQDFLLVRALESIKRLEIEIEDILILGEDADLLTGDERAASDASGEDHGDFR